MTLFGDFYFFIWAALLLIPAVVLGLTERPIKYYGALVTAVFIYMAMASSPKAIVNMIIYCVYQLLLVNAYLRINRVKPRNGCLYWLFILLSLAPLGVWKVSAFVTGHGIFAFLGLSYLTFRSVQVIIEIYDGLITEVKTFDFMYFLAFFPCLSSGPIDRSRRFTEDIDRKISRAEYIDLLGNGLFKIVLGMAYKFAFAAGFYQAITWLEHGSHLINDFIYVYIYGLSFGLYLFFDFAGYSLMAVGTSYILGIRSPDNFNKPFIATDMKDFWDRWHMSLSYWFRDFIFSRFMMRAIKGRWFKNKLTGASVGFIINMGVMGVWHGLDIQYIIYGLYHGVLLSLTEIYQKKSKFHKKHKKERLYKFVSWGITFNLAMFGFFIFSGEFTRMLEINW